MISGMSTISKLICFFFFIVGCSKKKLGHSTTNMRRAWRLSVRGPNTSLLFSLVRYRPFNSVRYLSTSSPYDNNNGSFNNRYDNRISKHQNEIDDNSDYDFMNKNANQEEDSIDQLLSDAK